MKIRAYRESDEDQVTELWDIVFPSSSTSNNPSKDIDRKLNVQRDLFIVALQDDVLIGTAMGGFDGHRGWVYFVAVHPDYQRQGIASSLMKHTEDELRKIGCSKLNLQVRANNAEVIQFYEKLGYVTEERVSMSKRLV
jgi:hypothetical protein